MNSTSDNSGDSDPVEGIDQTNGLAGDLDGDDHGAENPDDRHSTLLRNILENGLGDHAKGEPTEDDTDAGYSEEGQP